MTTKRAPPTSFWASERGWSRRDDYWKREGNDCEDDWYKGRLKGKGGQMASQASLQIFALPFYRDALKEPF